ncbi:protein of unknown function DUF881 [Beutenbergia cavernae DSM 12333]|uniref:Division initiation protein n=1 Tax=Beutenbergia cavernae (strain ATCC BAA-8 / DSM 12333 / CCUG 43141 / JCM 11478 / NBRC 16432 / NCIMB 13614 / HKI 0122) TaxID=471853 RepID=C5C6F0_BEUC1|nr:DUF881 domain-containing protein [Beutenbergia cavernae]ACQ80356.1 protein of unknown function DUF881 [Beutenbergia cavernae DSM 12333]
MAHVPEPSDVSAGAVVPAPARRRWFSRSQLLVAALCALLGFAIVLQVRQTRADEFASMRQDDLVRLLDEITQRGEELTEEQSRLRRDRNDLLSGSDAQQVAERNATVQGILAGTLPVEGPGIELAIFDAEDAVRASTFVHVIEELRNAGAESIEVNSVRIGTSSYVVDGDGGVVIDDIQVTSPYTILAIGEPQTLSVALDIPGGALATIRTAGARVDVQESDLVQILSTRTLADPEYAVPAPDDDD